MSTQPQTDADAMRATYRRLVEEMLNGHRPELIPQFVTDDYVFHGPGGQTLTGADEVTEMVVGYQTAFPDLHMTIAQMIVEGDRLCLRFRVTGTHDGPLGEVAPTGKQIDINGTVIGRFEGTKIAEEWESFDELQMMQQIGAA